MEIDQLVGQVYCGHALRLLSGMPGHSVDAALADPMYGTTIDPTPKRYIGCDLWPDYCRVALQRLRELEP
jgi:DNA modification methylase